MLWLQRSPLSSHGIPSSWINSLRGYRCRRYAEILFGYDNQQRIFFSFAFHHTRGFADAATGGIYLHFLLLGLLSHQQLVHFQQSYVNVCKEICKSTCLIVSAQFRFFSFISCTCNDISHTIRFKHWRQSIQGLTVLWIFILWFNFHPNRVNTLYNSTHDALKANVLFILS